MERLTHRWIPVEKKTPQVGEYVLGTNKYGEVLIYYYAWNSPHTKKMFFHLCGAAATITAWMPLPDPYQSEGNGDTAPKAFDKEKVIEEIKKRRDWYDMNEQPSDPFDIWECADIRERKGKWMAYDDAIKIIERGGIK